MNTRMNSRKSTPSVLPLPLLDSLPVDALLLGLYVFLTETAPIILLLCHYLRVFATLAASATANGRR
jgi:hypothetical protein